MTNDYPGSLITNYIVILYHLPLLLTEKNNNNYMTTKLKKDKICHHSKANKIELGVTVKLTRINTFCG